MADPITAGVGLAGIGASIGSAYYGAKGAKTSAEGKAAMYRYQAGMADLNQKISERNAQQALQDNSIANVQLGLKQGQRMGQIRAAQSASGLDINSGSAVEVRESQAAMDKMDQALLRREGIKKSYAHELEAATQKAQKGMYRAAASNALIEGDIAAKQSILGGVSSVSSKWLQGSQMGVF